MPLDLVQLPRATWDELYRIGVALDQANAALVCSYGAQELVNVNAAIDRDVLFNEGVTTHYETTPGLLVDGVWTCPATGVWQVALFIKCAAIPTSAIKQYSGTARIIITPPGGGVATIREATNLVNDTSNLLFQLTIVIPVPAGAPFTVDLDLARETDTATATVTSDVVFTRLGAA